MVSTTRRALLLMVAASAAGHRASAQTGARVTRIALKGYDPVAYFVDGKPQIGSAAYEVIWDEARWRFASARNLELFRADPERYAPQFGGSCAMQLSLGTRAEADPNNWLIVDGRLYVFATAAAPARFAADASRRSRAEDNWKTLKDRPTTR